MESLFKFVLNRPAVKNDKRPSIDLSQNSDFQAELGASIGNANPRDVMKTASNRFVSSSNFISSVSEVSLHQELELFKEKLDALVTKEKITQNQLKAAVNDSFGKTATALLADTKYKKSLRNLKDSIIAIKHLPNQHNMPLELMVNALRDLEVVAVIHENITALDSGESLRKFRKRSMKLPTQADLKSILAQREEDRKRLERERLKELQRQKKDISQKAELYKLLKKAIKEIMAIDSSNLVSSTQKEHRGINIPKEIQPLNLFKSEVTRLNSLGQLKILNAQTLIQQGADAQHALKKNTETSNFTAIQGLTNTKGLFTGAKKFKPNLALSTYFRFKDGTESKLSSSTKTLLSDRKLSISKMSIDKVVAILKDEMLGISAELEKLTEKQEIKSYKRIGNTMIVTKTPTVHKWGAMVGTPLFIIPDIMVLDNRIPKTKGSVAPVGIADLIIVKQQLKGYEGRDIAHIENILKGEKKVRDHRRYNQSITENFTEIETTKVEERELESTDRFELSRETSKTIQTDASLKAGLTVSGSYGPTVSFTASAEGSLSTSKQEANKVASNFSKDVTQRSLEKLTERVLESTRITITKEIEETNNHTLDNTDGTGHISGVYQWVEKVYEAQMYNYGQRMMFDFMIPEPGAYLIDAMSKAHSSLLELDAPAEFTLLPNQINDENYNLWTHKYGAKGITPPPEEFITKSYNYSAGEGEESTDFQNSGIISIDDGYVAYQTSVGLVCTQWSSERIVDVVVGRRSHRFVDGESWVWITDLNEERESIPLGFITNDLADIAIAIEIKCQRTSHAYRKWQLDTHSKLMDAYRAEMAEFEEKLAALEMRAGIEIEGKNPGLNLEVMKDELKKNCMSILTNQHFDLFDAINYGTNGLPQIDIFENEAEGPYVRFFEQAFEWEHITWLTYPYFWGRKGKWEERIAFEDPDPLFNQFIKAGYCRTVVPVRPGFEGAVDHFLTFGEIWNGGPLPPISNELYIPIADELAERLDRPGEEIPQGEPWEVRVPTNLVKLRADDQLPKWEKDDDGQWIES